MLLKLQEKCWEVIQILHISLKLPVAWDTAKEKNSTLLEKCTFAKFRPLSKLMGSILNETQMM